MGFHFTRFHKGYLRLFLFLYILCLKPLFQAKDKRLISHLKQYNFHHAIISDPSLLFAIRRDKNVTTPVFFIAHFVHFIYQNFYLIESNKWVNVRRKIGLSNLYIEHPKCLCNSLPFIPYPIPITNTYSNEKTIVYSVLTGDYDCVTEIQHKTAGVDYVLFTNNRTITSTTWDIVYLNEDMENTILSRAVKILAHKYLENKYDISIYVDANVVLYGDISILANTLEGNCSFAVTKHFERSTIKDEIEACIIQKGIDATLAHAQYDRYRDNGFSDELGLAECSILIRKHKDPELIKLMEAWYNEYLNGVKRDQISLLPCISKLGFTKYRLLTGSVWHNQYCSFLPHNN